MLALAQRNAERARLRQSDGRIEDFVADDTLQPGDVVVTDQGFRVFNGAGNARAAGDFKPVDGAAVPQRLRRSLGEMEKASGFRRNAPPP